MRTLEERLAEIGELYAQMRSIRRNIRALKNDIANMEDGRQNALDEGKPKYIGLVCRKHPELGGLRWTSSSNCIECFKEYRADYLKRKNLSIEQEKDKP